MLTLPATKRKSLQLLAACLIPLAFMAGCGGASSGSNNGTFSINPPSPSLDTNTLQTFKATLNNGQPADVIWQVANGDTTAGAGAIDGNGHYTPPAFLTADAVQVRVTASLKSNPSSIVSARVTVTPGFLQPLSPENSTMTAGSTLNVQGTISELNSGKIQWVVSTTANGSDGGTSLGTLGQSSCKASTSQYTTCTVSYKAPAVLPQNSSVYVIARVNNGSSITPLHILLNSLGVNSSPLTNQAVQKGLVQMGSSGGNNNDYDTQKDRNGNLSISDCCGGTFGALVDDGNGARYILSNNHVLASSDQARLGDSIVQPGLIDGGCTPFGQNGASVRPVAALTAYVPLASTQTNVDAAIALIDTTAVDASGSILQIGPSQSGQLTAAPPAGGVGEALSPSSFASGALRVVKSGRTTGLTCSTIESISQNVNVDYFKDCAQTSSYLTKTFTNQMSISGSNFTDAGDSGSLILDAANAQPIGLFYASGKDVSIASPIGDVLSEVARQAGTGGSFKVVGGAPHPVSCLDYDAGSVTEPSTLSISAADLAAAQQASNLAAVSMLNARKGILGTATGQSADSPGEAAVIVYVDEQKQNVAVPATVAGVRTRVVPTTAQNVANHTAPSGRLHVAGIHLPASILAPAIAIKEQYWKQLMSDPAIFGVGVAQSRDNPAEAALLIYVDRKRKPRSSPATIGGLRVRYTTMDRFHVTRSKSIALPHPSSCAIGSMVRQTREQQSFTLGPKPLPLP